MSTGPGGRYSVGGAAPDAVDRRGHGRCLGPGCGVPLTGQGIKSQAAKIPCSIFLMSSSDNAPIGLSIFERSRVVI